jgi:glycosyltransferase involved in cell wall biosynthesis
VIGDGSERGRLEALRAELPGADRIELQGERNDADRWYPRFDLFVLPSWNEGISCTIQEAMTSGLPVIASRVGGNPELINDGETGLLVSAGDEDELHAALVSLLDAPERRRTLGENARREALRRFGIDAMVARYDELYSTLFQTIPAHRYTAR